VLRIFPVSFEDDEGKYVLMARNDVGEEKYTVKVYVNIGPQGTRHRLLIFPL
jgi:hypothetical protein